MADSTHPTLPPLLALDLPPSDIQLPPIHELFAELDELTRQVEYTLLLSTSPFSPLPCRLHSPRHLSSPPHSCPHDHHQYLMPVCVRAHKHRLPRLYGDSVSY